MTVMRLSRASYYADFALAPVLMAILAWSVPVWSSSVAVGAWLGWVALGLVLWSLMEYVVHRYLYHRVPYFKEIHDAHHANPKALIGAPPVIGLALILLVSYVPLSWVDEAVASGAAVGMLAGYMAYMALHHMAHHGTVRPGTWLALARRHHTLHHHATEEGNFGIVTALWDHVFGTALTPRRANRRRSPARQGV